MKKFAVLAVALSAAAVAQAAVVTASLTYDLSGLGGIDSTSGGPVVIANGDTVSLTVLFENNQALTIGDDGVFESLYTWLYGTDNNSDFTINNSVLNLLGFSGTGGAASQYLSATETNGSAHIGPAFIDFLSAGQSVTFSGFTLDFTVQSILQSPYTYFGTWIIASGNVSVGPAVPVPEPSSLALAGLALTGLGAIARRRSRA